MTNQASFPTDLVHFRLAALAATVLLSFSCSTPEAPTIDPQAHLQEIETWRKERVAALSKPNGWPSLVALHWLEKDVETFGSSADADLLLPGSDDSIWGTFVTTGGQVQMEAEPGAGVTLDGISIEQLELVSDVDGEPTILQRGPIQFYLIDRNGELAIRAKDLSWMDKVGPPHIESFPIDPGYRVNARWVAYDPPKQIPVLNIIGQRADQDSPGAIEFEIDGSSYRLDALYTPERMFLIVGDQTNGDTTYGAGRYLYAGPVVDGRVTVDFNLLYNPPCVFTEFATCELPPRQNKLPIELSVGEKNYSEH